MLMWFSISLVDNVDILMCHERFAFEARVSIDSGVLIISFLFSDILLGLWLGFTLITHSRHNTATL